MTDTAIATECSPNYSAKYAPCLEVETGQTFVMQSADRFAGLYAGEALDRAEVASVVGPVYVKGVSAGDLVEVHIEQIKPVTPYAYLLTSTGYGILGERIEPRVNRVEVDEARAEVLPGRSVPYKPMIGKLGLAPAEGEVQSSNYGDFGGALSNIHVGPGATIYLRAHHDGGLVFMDDVHAGMGDGEATSSALEMAASVSLRCEVANDETLTPPLVLTDREMLALGQAGDLDTATQNATDAMLDLLQKRLGVDLTEAAMIMGSAVDLRIAFAGAQPKKVYAAIARELLDL